MKQLKKPNIQMQRKLLKSEAINQLLSLKRKVEQFEKMRERRKTNGELETEEDYHFLMSTASSACPQTEEACYQNTYTSSHGRGYERSSAKSHFNRIIL